MHNIIKNNYNYIHIWIQIIHRIRITYFLSHRWVLLSLSFLFLFLVLDIHISILSFLWFIYSKLFIFYTILTHLEQRLKKKKKNLDRIQWRKIRQQLKFNLKRVCIYIYHKLSCNCRIIRNWFYGFFFHVEGVFSYMSRCFCVSLLCNYFKFFVRFSSFTERTKLWLVNIHIDDKSSKAKETSTIWRWRSTIKNP